MKICCIGDLCADLLIPYGEVKKHLKNLQTGALGCSEVLFQYGGTCGNTSAVLAKLGARPYFVTDLCGDRIGRSLKESMEALGVDLSLSVENPNKSNMICIAVIEEDKERVMFPWLPPGSDYPKFSQENLSLLKDEAMIVLVGGMVMNNDRASMNAVIEKAERLKEAGSTVVFDLNCRAETYGMNSERRQAYERMIRTSDIILGSGVEEFFPVTGELTMERAIARMQKDCPVIIFRDGRKPVHIYDHDQEIIVPTDPVFVITTIGAGDTFNAGFLYALNEGLSIENCVRFANYVAGYMISTPGHLAVPPDAHERLNALR